MHSIWALGAPVHTLKRTQWVPGDLERVFAFFEDPGNLGRITPPWLNFSIRSMSTARIEQGSRITYRVKLMGLPMRWVSLIEEWEPGKRFVDTALVSPYILWRHEHTFEPIGGGVMLGDEVRYRLPFGPIGSMTHALLVRRQLEAIFSFRARTVADLMSGGVIMQQPPADPHGH
jgi:ligand-binding SRPBCC domain-containing protein